MKLFSLKNSLSPEAQSELCQAEATWRVVRREEPEAGTHPDLSAMETLSNSTRQFLEQRDLRSGTEARECFSSTHERLMQAISASKPIADVAGETPSGFIATAAPTAAFAPLKEDRQQRGIFSRLEASMLRLRLTLRYAGAVGVFLVAMVAGRRTAHLEAPFFPVHEVVAEFDGRVNAQEVNFDLQGIDPHTIAAIMSSEVGMKVRLPKPEKMGAKLLGVRRAEFNGIPTVEAHFEKSGNRFAFFQAKAARHSLRFVTETRLKDRVYLMRDLGNYRVVAWRADDSVLAVVSPLGWNDSLKVADTMRSSVSDTPNA